MAKRQDRSAAYTCSGSSYHLPACGGTCGGIDDQPAAIVYGSDAETVVIEDGEQVYPCRCGETHRGDYAAYTYHHHNCYHREPLVDIGVPDLPVRSYLMCPSCGEVFHVSDGKGGLACDA